MSHPGGKKGAANVRDWTEPNLDDIDISIPHVDCQFVANLIEVRNKERDSFLEVRATVLEKVEKRRNAFDESTLGDEVKANPGESVTDLATTTLFKPDLSDEEMEIYYHTRPEYDDGFVLVDTRTVNEVTSWGMIEGSKVLPAHELFDAFHMNPEEFLDQYGFDKPRPDQRVIFICQYGARALMSAQIVSWMGYPSVLYLKDGYYEWGKRYNLLLRRWIANDEERGHNVKRLAAFQAAKELQREIAPEFNELPIQEASKYLYNSERSMGKLTAGETLLEDCRKQLAQLREKHLGIPVGEEMLDSATTTAAKIAAEVPKALSDEPVSYSSPAHFREADVVGSMQGGGKKSTIAEQEDRRKSTMLPEEPPQQQQQQQ